MANSFQAKIDLNIAEFLLDLPTEFSLKNAKVEDEKLVLTIETELTVPENVTMQYQTDENGNVGLVGLNV